MKKYLRKPLALLLCMAMIASMMVVASAETTEADGSADLSVSLTVMTKTDGTYTFPDAQSGEEKESAQYTYAVDSVSSSDLTSLTELYSYGTVQDNYSNEEYGFYSATTASTGTMYAVNAMGSIFTLDSATYKETDTERDVKNQSNDFAMSSGLDALSYAPSLDVLVGLYYSGRNLYIVDIDDTANTGYASKTLGAYVGTSTSIKLVGITYIETNDTGDVFYLLAFDTSDSTSTIYKLTLAAGSSAAASTVASCEAIGTLELDIAATTPVRFCSMAYDNGYLVITTNNGTCASLYVASVDDENGLGTAQKLGTFAENVYVVDILSATVTVTGGETSTVDKTALAAAIAQAEALNADDYVQDSAWSALQGILPYAKEIYEDPDATQDTVDTYTQAILNYIANLTPVSAADLDYSALFAAYEQAEALNESDYTSASWNYLDAAMNNAWPYVKNGALAKSQDEIDEMTQAILNAIAGLVAAVDKTALADAIAQAEALNADDYVQDNWWYALQSVLELAKEVYEDEDATQEDVDTYTQTILDYIANLTPVSAADLDYSALIAAYEQAEALTESDYTSDSWAYLEAAMNNAWPYVKNGELAQSQDEIDEMTKAILDAIEGLVAASTSLDLSELEALVAQAEALNEEDYCEDTWTYIPYYLQTAKNILAMTEEEMEADGLDQDYIDQICTWLQNALNKLITHTWVGTVTTAATCEEGGVMTYKCERCWTTKTETIPATGHSWELDYVYWDDAHETCMFVLE
ncbi:MAG: hypothetical protein LUJ09_07780, partial [Firmicutes bacterium]|nr:hypothetical protein [Bacillota bacterium]